MSDNLFPTLLSPLQVGSVVLKNRIFSSGHDTVMVRDGAVTDQFVEYHRARAAGGAGLIILQVAGIHETARYTSHVLMATDDDASPATAVSRRPCTSMAAGCSDRSSTRGARSWNPATARSRSPSPLGRTQRAVPGDAAADVAGHDRRGRRRVRRGGAAPGSGRPDGVEIVASHGYLPAQFLNPTVNLRTDEYGGDLKNRARFLRENIAAVRAAVGSDFAVGVRLSGAERSRRGRTHRDLEGPNARHRSLTRLLDITAAPRHPRPVRSISSRP